VTRESLPRFDLYGELEVSPLASVGAIEAAYRSLVKRHHPDVVGAPDDERIKRLNLAREWLTDPRRRSRYDATRPDLRRKGASGDAGGEPPAQSFGVNAVEVRHFLSELRGLDRYRARQVWDGRTVAHLRGYTRARRSAVATGRAQRHEEWLFAREAASVIARGELGDSVLTEQVLDVVADAAGAIVIRDLIPPKDYELLLLPWRWRGEPVTGRSSGTGWVPVPGPVAGPMTGPVTGPAPEPSPGSVPVPPPIVAAPAPPTPVAAPAVLPAKEVRRTVAETPDVNPIWAGMRSRATSTATKTEAARATLGSAGRARAAAVKLADARLRQAMAGAQPRRRSLLWPAVAVIAAAGIFGSVIGALTRPPLNQEVAGITDAPGGSGLPQSLAPQASTSSTSDASPPVATEPGSSVPGVGGPFATPGSAQNGGGVPTPTPGPGATQGPSLPPGATPGPSLPPGPTPGPTPPPTPGPTPPPPGPTPTPRPTPTPGSLCQVVSLIGINTSSAQALWNAAGFSGTVLFSPAIPPHYRVGWQNLAVGSSVTCTSWISVRDAPP
jgi:hypothetical protein